jgi:hypothetical protein
LSKNLLLELVQWLAPDEVVKFSVINKQIHKSLWGENHFYEILQVSLNSQLMKQFPKTLKSQEEEEIGGFL